MRYLTLMVFMLVAGILVTRHPPVARWIWHRHGTFPDLRACAQEIERSRLPSRDLAARVMTASIAAARDASVERDLDEQTRSYLRAQGLANLALMTLYAPIGLAMGIVAALGARWTVLTFGRPPDLDLTRTKVVLDLSCIRPVSIAVERRRLPRKVTAAQLATYRDAWTVLRAGEGAGPVGRARAWVKALLALVPTGRPSFLGLLRGGVAPDLLAVREEMRELELLTPLREALLEAAAAHPDHPASIDHHGAEDGGLVRHKVGVLREALRLVATGAVAEEDRDGFITMAAVHDLGKVVSYVATDRGWAKADDLHAQNTAYVLRSLPELATEHGHDEERIFLALKHEHDPEGIPLDYLGPCKRLIELVHRYDSAVVPTESMPATVVDDAARMVVDLLPRMLADIGINRADGGPRPAGFYEAAGERGEELLVILEVPFREQLPAYLDKRAQRALELFAQRRPGKAHPSFLAVARQLVEAGAIPDTVRGAPVDAKCPLLSVRVGERTFRGVFPISLSWLGAILGSDEVGRLKRQWAARGFPITQVVAGVQLPDEDPVAPGRGKSSDQEDTRRCPACDKRLVENREGTHLVCKGFYQRTCGVRYPLKDGKPVSTCATCGKERIVVRPKDRNRLPFLGCPDRCREEQIVAEGTPAGSQSELAVVRDLAVAAAERAAVATSNARSLPEELRELNVNQWKGRTDIAGWYSPGRSLFLRRTMVPESVLQALVANHILLYEVDGFTAGQPKTFTIRAGGPKGRKWHDALAIDLAALAELVGTPAMGTIADAWDGAAAHEYPVTVIGASAAPEEKKAA